MKKIKTLICTAMSILTLSTCAAMPASAVTYTSLEVPNINSSFKTYMDYRTITNKSSAQYKLIQEWAWADCEGFLRCNGERDLGIADDYYLIALGIILLLSVVITEFK